MKYYMFIFTILICSIKRSENKKSILIDRFEECDRPQNSPFRMQQPILTIANHITYINTSFQIFKDINRLKLVMKVIRCSNKEQLDSCAYFTTLSMKDTCPLLKSNGTMISTMTYAYKPPMLCPLRKGKYVLENGTIDPNLTQFFPLGKWYWKLEAYYYDSDINEYLVKVCLDGHVIQYYL